MLISIETTFNLIIFNFKIIRELKNLSYQKNKYLNWKES